jgi:hypothetical protein
LNKPIVSLYQRRDALLNEQRALEQSLRCPVKFDPEDWRSAINRALVDDLRDAGTRATQFTEARDSLQAEADAAQTSSATRLQGIEQELIPLRQAIAGNSAQTSATAPAHAQGEPKV